MGMITRRAALGLAAAALASSAAPAAVAPPLKLRRGVNAFPWFALTREFPAPRRDYMWPPYQLERPVPTVRDLAKLREAGFDFIRLPVDPGPFLAAPAGERRALLDQLSRGPRAMRCAGSARRRQRAGERGHALLDAGAHDRRDRRAGVSRLSRAGARDRGAVAALARGAGADQRTRLAPAPPPIRARCARALLEGARRAAPGLTLVASGGCGSLIQGLADFDPASVARFAPLLYTFHFYEPYVFTHQSASWMGERFYHTLTGVPWPGDRGLL